MPCITLHPSNRTISVPDQATLLNGLQAADVPVASSCHGEGICRACRVRVIEGAEHLSAPDALEQHALTNGDLQEDERLACRTCATGPVTLTALYW